MSKSFTKTKTGLGLEDLIMFGDKFYNQKVSYAILMDPKYVEWCSRQKSLLVLAEDSKQYLQKQLKELELEERYTIEKEVRRATKVRAADGVWEDVPF